MLYNHIPLDDYMVTTDFPEKYDLALFVPAEMRPALKRLRELNLEVELKYACMGQTGNEWVEITVNGDDVGTVHIDPESDWVQEIINDLAQLIRNPAKYGFAS